jgi:hypothetical protein
MIKASDQFVTVLEIVEANDSMFGLRDPTVKEQNWSKKNSISDATYYNWKSKYGGMEASDIKHLKSLEDENYRLKQMFADLSLDHKILKDVVE